MSAAAGSIAFAAIVFAQAQFGSAAEARAMLERTVVALKADKAEGLDRLQKGEAGFKDRDLYAFCANVSDSVLTAHPALKGTPLRSIKDKDGKAFGEEMMKVATDGSIGEVSYMWPRPGETAPVQKVSFVTRAADQVCGVGYYK